MRNEGRLEVGSRVRIMCRYGSSELRVGPTGKLRIGDNVAINYGADIQAATSITIGDRVSFGPRVTVSDSDFYVPDDPRCSEPAAAKPVVIGDGAWLASRVTVMPGASIGAGSVITAGSIVTGDVPAGVIAGGSPLRVLRRLTEDDTSSNLLTEDAETVASGGTDPTVVTAADVATGDLSPEPKPPTAGGLLIADFTIDPLALALAKRSGGAVTAEIAPFGTVFQSLLAPPTTEHTDFAVVWTQPHAVLPEFQKFVDEDDGRLDLLIDAVDQFTRMIEDGLGHFGVVFVPTWTLPPWFRGRGLFDLRPGGSRHALSIANARLAEWAADSSNAVVVDAQHWMTEVGAASFSDRLWYLGKIPFDDKVNNVAADEILDGLAAWRGVARKLVVVDLDNTMWGGVVGDDGWESLRLGGHDGDGEAFVEFQRGLLRLKKRGVALAIASKNEESVALEAIDQHDQMVLGRDDFIGWRINWSDKAGNIADLVGELNLGLQSVVFIDDNPHERSRVREALPEVLVPEWPVEPTAYPEALAALSCFDQVASTEEDRNRTAMYATENRRQQLKEDSGTLDDWIRELSVEVRAVEVDQSNIERTAQLLNKTNQMNATTRRMTGVELLAWASEPGHATLCIDVSDRLGDAGLVGIVSIETTGSEAMLVDFVLSCRVMGRRVEDSLVWIAAQQAKRMGAAALSATVIPTAKNVPCRRFFDGSAFETVGQDVHRIALDEPHDPPADIAITTVAS